MASQLVNPPLMAVGGGDAVYVAAVPLRAANGPPQLLMSAAYSLNLWDFQHFMVVIKPYSPLPDKVVVFDFQPQNPESIEAALSVLSCKSVPGVVRQRSLTKLPKRKCWFVGSSCMGKSVEMAIQFNDTWKTELIVGVNDCRNYTNGLVEHLTGEPQVLELLRRCTQNQNQTNL